MKSKTHFNESQRDDMAYTVPPIGSIVTFSDFSIWYGEIGTVIGNADRVIVKIDGYGPVTIFWRNHINIIEVPDAK